MRVEYKVDKVPFFKHSEQFRLGQEVTMGRRDKKAGQQHATLRKTPSAVHVHIQLDGPDTGMLQLLMHACLGPRSMRWHCSQAQVNKVAVAWRLL